MPSTAPASWIVRLARPCASALIVLALVPLEVALPAERTEVFLLGSLYRRHESVPSYDLQALRRVILAIKPDVLVVDCTPREVREQQVHASKIEYPGVIFPLIREHGWRVYPAEPDEPLFTEIVQSIVKANEALATERPEASAALRAYASGVYEALAVRWTSPSAVHDEVTVAAFAGKEALDADLVGPAMRDGARRWNRHWADAIRTAVRENPGRRVLAIAGIENRAAIAALLKADPRIALVDMAAWLRAHAAP